MINQARLWGSDITDGQLISELDAIDQDKHLAHLVSYRNEALNNYVKPRYDEFEQAKINSKSMPELFENVKKEQEFLLELGLNMSDDDYKYKKDAKAGMLKYNSFEEIIKASNFDSNIVNPLTHGMEFYYKSY